MHVWMHVDLKGDTYVRIYLLVRTSPMHCRTLHIERAVLNDDSDENDSMTLDAVRLVDEDGTMQRFNGRHIRID